MALKANLDQTLKVNRDLADIIARMCEENQKIGQERDKLRDLAVQSDQASVQNFENEVQRRLRGSQAELEKTIKDEVERRLKSELELAADARAESEKRLESEIKNLQDQLAGNDKLAENARDEAESRLKSTEVSLMREIDSLQGLLSQSKDRESETLQQLASAEKELKDVYNEQGRLERNLKQRNDDHCKLEILKPIMEQQGERINQLEREVEEQKGVIEAKKENLDQQVKLKTKDRQLKDARNAASLANQEKNALRAGAERLAAKQANALAQAQADVQEEKNKRERREGRIKNLKNDVKDLQQKVQELSMENKKLVDTKNKSFWSLRRK